MKNLMSVEINMTNKNPINEACIFLILIFTRELKGFWLLSSENAIN